MAGAGYCCEAFYWVWLGEFRVLIGCGACKLGDFWLGGLNWFIWIQGYLGAHLFRRLGIYFQGLGLASVSGTGNNRALQLSGETSCGELALL